MLVLSRKVGQRILIGDRIAVTVVRVGPGVVRIGIEAPSEMPVVREELKDANSERVATLVSRSDDGQWRDRV
jgi:carbon storage regulator CsrA